MSTAGGPRITSDNLVLCLDAHDAKSYRGEPTTNVFYNNGQANSLYLGNAVSWTNSGSYTLTYNATDIRKPIGYRRTNLYVNKGVCVTTGSQHFGSSHFTPALNTEYAISVWWRQSRVGAGNPYIRGSTRNQQLGTFYYKGVAGPSNWPANKWLLLTGTLPSYGSAESGVYISNYIGTTVGDTNWFFGPQAEAKGYATPRSLNTTRIAATGTRSTTDAWKDRSGNGNHGDFVGGVNTGVSHYRKGQVIEPKSNAYLDFDGTDDKIDIGSLGTNGEFSESTISIWFKKDAQASNYGNVYDCNYGATTYNKGPRMEVDIAGSVVRVYMSSDAGSYTSISFGNLSNDVWYNAVLTVAPNSTSQDLKAYTNGALVSSSTSSSSYVWDGDMADLYLGVGYTSGRHFTGQIAAFQIYKKVLTAAQIKANFNAQRGRYGV